MMMRQGKTDMNVRPLIACLSLWLLCAASPLAAQSADYVREKRWADEVVPSLLVGEAVWLQDARSRRFLGLHAKQSPGTTPAVILVHGMGIHPDYGMVGDLRTRLADAGYATLSLQMPVLAAEAQAEGYEALFDEAAGRIAAGVAYLQAQGMRRIVLVAHSVGARMAQRYVIAHPGAPLAAWVPLSITSGEFETLPGLGYPVLDVYGERDFPLVLKTTAARARTIAPIAGSRQAVVPGADHYFAGKEKELADVIRAFIETLK
jgi:dienelactone hydrolase